jgi:hypothetical protein
MGTGYYDRQGNKLDPAGMLGAVVAWVRGEGPEPGA